jgi:hypothetical protein
MKWPTPMTSNLELAERLCALVHQLTVTGRRDNMLLHDLWDRISEAKFNGVLGIPEMDSIREKGAKFLAYSTNDQARQHVREILVIAENEHSQAYGTAQSPGTG